METSSLYPGTGKGQNIAVIIIVVVVVALVAWIVIKTFGGISSFFDSIGKTRDSVLQKIGVQDSKQEAADKVAIQKAKEQASLISSPWNPAFYKNSPNDSLLFYSSTAKKLAAQIYDSVGIVYDNSDQGVAAIKQAQTQTQISFLADIFNQLYSQDLFAYMQFHYDTEAQLANLHTIIDYVNSLPPYKK
jgi:hypothetical protein